MNYRFRTPEIIPTLVMAGVVALMFGLGFWQIERLRWKNAFIAGIEEAQMQAPKELFTYNTATFADAAWHNVITSGILLHNEEMHATPRYLKGVLGYAIITPLAVNTPAGVRYVLVNRGWVPPEKKDPKTRSNGNVTDVVKVEGVIRTTMPQGMFRPDNNPEKNLWFWYDIPAMAQHSNLHLLPVLIDATRITQLDGKEIKDSPHPFPIEISIRNDHLGYAITWFLIGIAGIVIFVVYYAERKE